MCFRPADATAGGAQCPNCGKKLQSMGGIPLKKCPFCATDLTAEAAAAPAAPAASAPAPQPNAPKAPTAPKPPLSSS